MRAREAVKGGDRRAGFCHCFIRHAEDNVPQKSPSHWPVLRWGPGWQKRSSVEPRSLVAYRRAIQTSGVVGGGCWEHFEGE